MICGSQEFSFFEVVHPSLLWVVVDVLSTCRSEETVAPVLRHLHDVIEVRSRPRDRYQYVSPRALYAIMKVMSRTVAFEWVECTNLAMYAIASQCRYASLLDHEKASTMNSKQFISLFFSVYDPSCNLSRNFFCVLISVYLVLSSVLGGPPL